MHRKTIVGLLTFGMWGALYTISISAATVSAATEKPSSEKRIAAEKESCVIRVQNAPRTLVSASLRACPLKRALNLLETHHVAISGYPDKLGSSLLTHSFEKLSVHEALQRMFAPYNYILYAESGRVRIEIIGLLSNNSNPPVPTIPLPSEITAHPSSIPQALIRPTRRSGIPSDNTKQAASASEVSASPPGEVREETFDFRVTDDQGRKLPPYVPNAVPPSYDPYIAAKGLPSAPPKPLPSFVPITNKTGPVIQGPAPKPLPAFTPDMDNTVPK